MGFMKNNFKLDFLCVGFQKCATTTLDTILGQHSCVALPTIKEIHFEEWGGKCENPMKVIESKFFAGSDYINKRVGIVDPNLRDCPREIRKRLGKNIKLIFIMRNPVDRLFSYYKMALKLGFYDVYQSTLYGKEISNVRKSFGRYVREELIKENKASPILWGNYIDVIMDFSRYFERDKMFFIIFEDFIHNPEKVTRELFEFLSLPYEEVEFKIWEFSGNRISKNALCFKINSTIIFMREKSRCSLNASTKQFNKIDNFYNSMAKLTTKENNESMSIGTRKQLERYYDDSTRKLEDFLGIDLSEKWF